MEKVASNFNFNTIEKIMGLLEEDHSSSTLNTLKNELNKFFIKAKCREILYTNNTDKLFFGMRIYPLIYADTAMDIITDIKKDIVSNEYYLEFDSKLFDPMLGLDEHEYTAILLHEIGHIVYDTSTIDEVRKQLDIYMVKSGTDLDPNASKSYRELLAYALKDSVVKVGSIFSKIGNDEIIADSFVVACGYGPYLESGMRKISRSNLYLNKNVDDRLIAMSWVLRLKSEFKLRRLPAIKTLNTAKQLTGSKLEQRELLYASNVLNRMDDPVTEGAIDNIKSRFSKKFNDFKVKGIRSIKNDVYELNLRVRCAESEEDLLYVIRTVNTDISILRDYLTEDISDEEREEVNAALQSLYDVRETAAKNKEVRSKYDSLIQVVYPNM